MRYEDFLVQISSHGDGSFVISVLQSPAGEEQHCFELPFDRDELPALLRRLDAGIRHSRPAPAVATNLVGPRRMGEELFAALFSGRVLARYERSLGMVGNRGLRIKLKLNPRLPEVARIQNLPWELLARPDGGEYLSLSPASPVVRYLDVPVPVHPPLLPLRLRILVAASQPADLPILDLEQERRRLESIRSIWQGRAHIEIITLPRASLARLREILQTTRCHVLHFIGHGSFDPATGEGSLEMMGADGDSETAHAGTLGSLLGEFKTLQLVVLNACLTARTSEPDWPPDETEARRFQPFAGVAQALARSGIPAVVAMQREITDRAAIAFSEALYRWIATGHPVDAAVAEGRQAVRDQDPDGLEWSTPALFMRAPEGVLFRKWPGLRLLAPGLMAAVLIVLLAVAGYRSYDAWKTSAEASEHNIHGVTLIEDGHFEDARQEFLSVLDLDPDSAVAHSNLGELDFLEGLYERAAERYLAAAELEPGSALYRYNLGSTLLKLNRHPEAIESLERARKLDPDRLPAYNELAKAYRELGRLADARKTLERGLEKALAQPADKLPPGWLSPLYKNLGRVALDENDPAAAAQHFRESYSLLGPSGVSELAEVAFLLALAHHELGESAETCWWLGELRRHAPDLIGPWDFHLPDELATDHGCTLRLRDQGDHHAANE